MRSTITNSNPKDDYLVSVRFLFVDGRIKELRGQRLPNFLTATYDRTSITRFDFDPGSLAISDDITPFHFLSLRRERVYCENPASQIHADHLSKRFQVATSYKKQPGFYRFFGFEVNDYDIQKHSISHDGFKTRRGDGP